MRATVIRTATTLVVIFGLLLASYALAPTFSYSNALLFAYTLGMLAVLLCYALFGKEHK